MMMSRNIFGLCSGKYRKQGGWMWCEMIKYGLRENEKVKVLVESHMQDNDITRKKGELRHC